MSPHDGNASALVFAPELAELEESERVSLCELLDRVLNKGVVAAGEITISVADVDLLYLSLQLVLTSIETARRSFAAELDGTGSGRESEGNRNASGR